MFEGWGDDAVREYVALLEKYAATMLYLPVRGILLERIQLAQQHLAAREHQARLATPVLR